MYLIMCQIEPEHPELFAPEFGKIAESDFIYTLSSANIYQSPPNLVKMYLITRSQVSSIIDLIGPELSELSALKFKKIAILDFVYILTSTNTNQSAPNLDKMYVTIRSPMSLIMDLIVPELSELFALEFSKIAESDFVYTLASANIDQSKPNLATIYIPLRPWMNSILGQIEREHPELFALEFRKMA